MAALQVGDPMEPETEVGPLAPASIRDGVAEQVDALGRGRRAPAGRRPPRAIGPGFFYAPTVLADVPPTAPAARARRCSARWRRCSASRDIDDAIALANDTPFGLGASGVDARPRPRPSGFADELEAGSVFINDMVASDPRFPFGGVKRSGYGRELGALRPPRVRQRQDGADDRSRLSVEIAVRLAD